MSKFHFLCTHHHTWLTNNPDAIAGTWLQSYSRSQDFADEHLYVDAANHAGAAFEAAEIELGQQVPVTTSAIRRYTDASVLLVHLLQIMAEHGIAQAVFSSAITRLESLLLAGIQLNSVLSSCERLLRLRENRADRISICGTANNGLLKATSEQARIL